MPERVESSEDPEIPITDLETYNGMKSIAESFKEVSKDVFEGTGLDPFGKLVSDDPNLTIEEAEAALSYIFSGRIWEGREKKHTEPPVDAQYILEEVLLEAEKERPGLLERVEKALQAEQRLKQALNRPSNNPENS
jgi:hypothetical protein